MTSRTRVWTWTLYAALAVVVLSQASLALRPESGLPDSPLTEDGYYALTVARNIALGNGVTIDGKMLTNGFQPLFTFVCVPLFWLSDGDRMLALRFLLLLHALTITVAAMTFGSILRHAGGNSGDLQQLELRAAAGALVYTSAAFIFRTHFNGLETGWQLMMYLLCWRMYQRHGVETPARAGTYGAMLGLLVLTRIDAIFFVIVSATAEFLGKGDIRAQATRFFVISGTAFLISLPWWTYNLIGFGSLMPTSGTAQEHLGVEVKHIVAMASALSVVATPSFWVGQHEGVITFAIRLLLFGALLAFMPRALRSAGLVPGSGDVERRTWAFARNLAITFALLTAWYLLSLGTTWFYERYLAPLALLGAAALAIVVVHHGQPRLRTAPLIAVLVLSAQIPLFVFWHHTNRVYRGSIFFNYHLQQVLEHVPAGEVVASGQSGTLGYFRDGVVNCDGKVNSEVLAYRRDLGTYLDKLNIDWWADGRFFAAVEPQSIGWQKVSSSGRWGLYRRIPQS